MTRFFFFFVLVALGFCSNQSTAQFNAVRLNADLHGVYVQDSVVLCYGDFGVTKRSYNNGTDWQHISIGDFYDIKKIIGNDGTLFACTNKALFFSTDVGVTWSKSLVQFSSPVIQAVKATDSTIVFLLKNGLFSLNLKQTNSTLEKLVDLDSTYTYIALEYFKGSLFVAQQFETTLLRFTTNTKKLETLDGVTQLYSGLLGTKQNMKLFSVSDTLFASQKLQYSINTFYNLSYSIDTGKTWFYRIQNNTSFPLNGIVHTQGNLHCLKDIYRDVAFVELPSNRAIISKGSIDSSKQVSVATEFNTEYSIEEMKEVNSTTLIGVGKHCTIMLSSDAGKHWRYISLFNTTFNSTTLDLEIASVVNLNQVVVLGDSFSNADDIVGSSNGGTTWLPPLVSSMHKSQDLVNKRLVCAKDDSTYVVHFNSQSGDSIQTNCFSSSDFGTTYTARGLNSLFLNIDTNSRTERFVPKNLELLKLQSNLVQIGTLRVVDSISKRVVNENFCRSFVYDKDVQQVATATIPVNRIISYCLHDNSLWVLGIADSGIGAGQPNQIKNYAYQYKLLHTKDGLDWRVVEDSLPFKQEIVKWTNNYHFWENRIENSLVLLNNTLYFPSFKYENQIAKSTLYMYNLQTKLMDSVDAPFMFSSTMKNLSFVFKSQLYFINTENTLCYLNENNGNRTWDSIPLYSILNARADSTLFQENFDDHILQITMVNDSTGFMFVGREKSSSILVKQYDMYVVKLTTINHNTTVSVETAIEENQPYVWHSLPLPTPSNNHVTNTIHFWNVSTTEPSFEVYDVIGNKVVNPKMSIQRSSINTIDVQWDCTTVPDGVYQIVYKFGTTQKSYPVLVLH